MPLDPLIYHHRQKAIDGIHISHSFEYATAVERNSVSSAQVTQEDVNKLALQLDDHTFWMLTNYNPVTWQLISFPVSDKIKLDGIEPNAQVNQDAFSNIKVGNEIIAAREETDTLTLVPGNNITITPDASTKSISISATPGESILIPHKDTHLPDIPGANDALPVASTTYSGLMSPSAVVKLSQLHPLLPGANITLTAQGDYVVVASTGSGNNITPITSHHELLDLAVGDDHPQYLDIARHSALHGPMIHDSLDGLTDVKITEPSERHLLAYINAMWVNAKASDVIPNANTAESGLMSTADVTKLAQLYPLVAGNNILLTPRSGQLIISATASGTPTPEPTPVSHHALLDLATGDDHLQYLNITRHNSANLHIFAPDGPIPHDILDNLTNIKFTDPIDKQALVYSNSTQMWINSTLVDIIPIASITSPGLMPPTAVSKLIQLHPLIAGTNITLTPDGDQLIITAGAVPDVDPPIPAVTSHHALLDLTVGDDHPQYINLARHNNGLHAFSPNGPIPHDSLDGLTNIKLTNPITNQALVYSLNRTWVNSTITDLIPIATVTVPGLMPPTAVSKLMQLHPLIAGANVTLTADGDQLIIAASASGGASGPISHHALLDLAVGDDHPQYINSARHNGGLHTFSPNGPVPHDSLEGLTNVKVATPTTNQALVYSPSKTWVNSTLLDIIPVATTTQNGLMPSSAVVKLAQLHPLIAGNNITLIPQGDQLVIASTATGGGSTGTTTIGGSHHSLLDLTDGDDHTQYLNTTRHNSGILHAFVPSGPIPHDSLNKLTNVKITNPINRQVLTYIDAAQQFDAWLADIEASGLVSLAITVNITNVRSVYFLMNTLWGSTDPNGLVSIVFEGTGGVSYTKKLIGNIDIRDYNNGRFTNTINATTTKNAWTNDQQRLDMIKVDLPSSFSLQTLNKITVNDTGGRNIQRVFIKAITVATASTTAPIDFKSYVNIDSRSFITQPIT